MRRSALSWILPVIITLLALADGFMHLRLDFVLFRGRLWGSPSFGGPPPGATPPAGAAPGGGGPPQGGKMPSALPFINLPLNELFLLNCIGFVVLIVLLWVSFRWFARGLWVVDILLIGYIVLTIVGWVRVGKPNPMGLGYLTKEIEAVLLIALLAHIIVQVLMRSRESAINSVGEGQRYSRSGAV